MRAILLVALITACGGKSTPATTTTTSAPTETAAKPLPDVPFDQLDQALARSQAGHLSGKLVMTGAAS